MRGLFVTGTDTGVGKTWVGCAIARALTERGVRVVPRKPVESGCRREGDTLIPEDARALMKAAGDTSPLDQVCPWRFEPAISPQRAARLAEHPLTTVELAEACWTGVDTDRDFLLVEGAGGFYSPLCENGLNADLARTLDLPVLLVAEDRLGTINHILLSLEAMARQELEVLAVILNRPPDQPTPPGMDNLEDLKGLGIPVYTVEHTLPDALIASL